MDSVEQTERVVVLGFESKDADLAVNGARDIKEAIGTAGETVGKLEVGSGDDET